MRTTYLVLVLAVALVAANSRKPTNSFEIADHSLRITVKNAEPIFNTEFDERLRKAAILPWANTSPLPDKKLFFQTDADTAVELENIHVVSAPQLKLTSVKSDLECRNMAVDGSVGTIIIQGRFSVSSLSSLKIFPVFSEGNFSLVLDSVEFEGHTGLKVNGDSFLTENYDIEYIPAHVILTAQYSTAQGPLNMNITTKGFDDAFRSKIKTHLLSFMNRHLQKQFDAICSKSSLKSLLLNNDSAVTNYKSHVRTVTDNANKYVDELLDQLNKQTDAANKCTIKLPYELRASFSIENQGMLRHDSFYATKAWVKDLCTLQRTGNTTLSNKEGVTTIFGSVGLRKLQAGFDNYYAEFANITRSGTLSASASSPSLFFKVSVNSKVPTAVTVAVKELYVESVGDIEVKVTGLEDQTNLVSKITPWVLGFITDRIAPYINDYIKDFAVTSVTLVNALKYFQL